MIQKPTNGRSTNCVKRVTKFNLARCSSHKILISVLQLLVRDVPMSISPNPVINIEGTELTESHKDLEVTYTDIDGNLIQYGKISHWT